MPAGFSMLKLTTKKARQAEEFPEDQHLRQSIGQQQSQDAKFRNARHAKSRDLPSARAVPPPASGSPRLPQAYRCTSTFSNVNTRNIAIVSESMATPAVKEAHSRRPTGIGYTGPAAPHPPPRQFAALQRTASTPRRRQFHPAIGECLDIT